MSWVAFSSGALQTSGSLANLVYIGVVVGSERAFVCLVDHFRQVSVAVVFQ